MTQFELHESHDWRNFEDSLDDGELTCHRCEICTYNSPALSAEPCEFAMTGERAA